MRVAVDVNALLTFVLTFRVVAVAVCGTPSIIHVTFAKMGLKLASAYVTPHDMFCCVALIAEQLHVGPEPVEDAIIYKLLIKSELVEWVNIIRVIQKNQICSN